MASIHLYTPKSGRRAHIAFVSDYGPVGRSRLAVHFVFKCSDALNRRTKQKNTWADRHEMAVAARLSVNQKQIKAGQDSCNS